MTKLNSTSSSLHQPLIHVEKSSARSTAKQRNKVEKAISNANKKSRKLAKGNPQNRSKLHKDPGVPKLFPFKEKLLKEIEQSRQNLENERQKRKDSQALQMTQGSQDDMEVEDSGIARLAQSAEERDVQYEQEDMMVDEEDGDVEEHATKKDTSRKAYNKEFKKVMEDADVILYILDARDPEGTRSKEVEQMIRESPHGEKQLILILNKIGSPRRGEKTNDRLDSPGDFKSMATLSTSLVPCPAIPFQHKSPILASQSPSKETYPPPSQCTQIPLITTKTLPLSWNNWFP